MNGIITQTVNWVKHPIYSDANIADWLGFLSLVLILSFLWSTVVARIE